MPRGFGVVWSMPQRLRGVDSVTKQGGETDFEADVRAAHLGERLWFGLRAPRRDTEDPEGPVPDGPSVREPWPEVPYTHHDRCEAIRPPI